MVRTIVIRTVFMLGMLVTAHAIKPFSPQSIAQHLIYSSRSFAFVLPEEKRAEFDTVNDLALSLSDGLLKGGAWRYAEKPAVAPVAPESWQLALKLVTLDGQNRVMPGPRSTGKRSAPAKRLPRAERADPASVIAMAEPAMPAREDGDRLVETRPVTTLLPIDTEEVAQIHALPIAFLTPAVERARKNSEDCARQDMKRAILELIDGRKLRVTLQTIEPAEPASQACEKTKTEASEQEIGPMEPPMREAAELIEAESIQAPEPEACPKPR